MELFDTKKIDEIKEQSKEPEVVESILKAMNRQNDDVSNMQRSIKDSIKELNTEFEAYKKKLGSTDPVDKVETEKLKDSMLLKQEIVNNLNVKMDALNSRLDAIEVYNQRNDGSYYVADSIEPGKTIKDQTNYFRAMVGYAQREDSPNQAKRPLLADEMPKITEKQFLDYERMFIEYVFGITPAETSLNNRTKFFDALSVVYPPAAGWFVLPVIDTEVKKREREMDPLLRFASVMNVTSGDNYQTYVDYTYQEARMRENEYDAGEMDPVKEFDKFNVPFNEIYKKLPITRQAMDDIPQAEAMIGQMAGDAIAYTEAKQVVTGNGIIEPLMVQNMGR
jgi:HK97 family phage major capsid protein